MNAKQARQTSLEAQMKSNKELVDTTLFKIKKIIAQVAFTGDTKIEYDLDFNTDILSSIIIELKKDDYNVSLVQGKDSWNKSWNYLKISW